MQDARAYDVFCRYLYSLDYPSARGPSTSGGTFTTPLSKFALIASISGPVFVLPSAPHSIFVIFR